MTEDVTKWLDGHGLGKYVDAFEENESGVADIPLLTEDDLREMGLPIGPRRRFLTLAKADEALVGAETPIPEPRLHTHFRRGRAPSTHRDVL